MGTIASMPGGEQRLDQRFARSAVDGLGPCLATPSCGPDLKQVRTFLSYHKKDCAAEARILKSHFEAEAAPGFGAEIVLESGDFQTMRTVLDHVRESDCIVLVLSKCVMTWPQCVLELCTAIDSAVPIVAVNVTGKDYDFEDAERCLTFLDKELDQRDPEAKRFLLTHGLMPMDAAYVLSNVIPNISSVEVNFSAPDHVLFSSLADLVEAVLTASPVLISNSKLDWLECRNELLRPSMNNRPNLDGNCTYPTAPPVMLEKTLLDL